MGYLEPASDLIGTFSLIIAIFLYNLECGSRRHLKYMLEIYLMHYEPNLRKILLHLGPP